MLTNITAGPQPPKPGEGCPPVTGPDTLPDINCDPNGFATRFLTVAIFFVLVAIFAVYMVIATPHFQNWYKTRVEEISKYFRRTSKVFVSLVFVLMLTLDGDTYMPIITRVTIGIIVLYILWNNKKAEGKLFFTCSTLILLPVVTRSIDYPIAMRYGSFFVYIIALVWKLIRGYNIKEDAISLADLFDAMTGQLSHTAPICIWFFWFSFIKQCVIWISYLTNFTCYTDDMIPKWFLLFFAIIIPFLMFRENSFPLALTIAAATMIFHIPRLEGTYTVQTIVEPNSWTEYFKIIVTVNFFDFKPQWRILCHDVTYLQAVNRDNNPALMAYTDEGLMDAIIKCNHWQKNSIKTTYIMIVSVVFFLMQKIGAASDVEDSDLDPDSEDPDSEHDKLQPSHHRPSE